MKLHLGCGKRKIKLPGWVNIDIDPANEPDVVADCFDALSMRGLESSIERAWPDVEVVYACHVLEHAGRSQYQNVLTLWYKLLRPGGILRLAVPDIKAVFGQYWKTESLDRLLGFLYGGQRNEHDYHKMGWDLASLTRDLQEAGFSMVQRYDRDKTEHADVDDYSASYLPNIKQVGDMVEYKRGALLSLNVEAIK